MNEDTVDQKWRKSKKKEDSKSAAETLKERVGIEPYNIDQASDLISAAAISGELQLVESGRSYRIANLEEWFTERVQPNTISLTREDYFTALANSFELLTIGDPAKSDFGSSRQREFGQLWTDFARGYLGEIAVKRLFSASFNVEVDLRQRETDSGVEEYLPTDVTRVKENGDWRSVDTTLSVKTSKLGSMWLPIPGNELSHSEAFTFVKIGIPLNHIAIFLKEVGGVDELVEHIDPESGEKILEEIPEFSNIPAYIPGFAWRQEFENGDLETSEATKNVYIESGIGDQSEIETGGKGKLIRGIGSMSEKYIAGTGALQWEKAEWKDLLDQM